MIASGRGRRSWLVAGWIVLALAGCRVPAPAGPAPEAPAATGTGGAVERGRYLVTILACNDCHTPFTMGPQGPSPDMTRMLSGHPEQMELPPPPPLGDGPWVWLGTGTNTAFAGPWGISYATNLTPDEATGMGAWTEQIFANTLRTGRHWGQSRPILPPMPWPSYAHMTDEDLQAVFAYLRSIPAISNRVPEAQPVLPSPPPQQAALR